MGGLGRWVGRLEWGCLFEIFSLAYKSTQCPRASLIPHEQRNSSIINLFPLLLDRIVA